MSMDKEDARLKLTSDMKARLLDIAAFNGMDQSKQLTLLVEKALVGEHHAVIVALERIERNKRLRAHEGAEVTCWAGSGMEEKRDILKIVGK